jgi:hypothetical protein
MIIFDLDGTLADCEHRRHWVDPRKNSSYELAGYCPISNPCGDGWYHKITGDEFKPDYEKFEDECDKDSPIVSVLSIFSQLSKVYDFQIWSGRSESCRQKTIQWFYDKWFIGAFEKSLKAWIDQNLKMRPIGDFTPDEQLKERWLNDRCSDLIEAIIEGRNPSKHDIDFVFDDRPKVVEMWRRRGIFVFDCNQTGKEF